jgi:hypothetical protein
MKERFSQIFLLQAKYESRFFWEQIFNIFAYILEPCIESMEKIS